jgi:transposase
MGKYADEAKLAAVRDYCSGKGGLKSVASRHNVDVSMLRQWIAGYRAHGEAGVQTKKRRPSNFSAEFKLSVLERMREEGLSQRQVAAIFNIRRFNVIGEWERKYSQGGPQALARVSSKHHKKMPKTPLLQVEHQRSDQERSHQDLLDEVSRLRMENAYLKKLEALVRAKDQQAQKSER